jgi:transposase
VIEDATEVAYWRERAVRAEADKAVVVERLARAETRIGQLAEQVAVLSRMLFGRSSERTGAGGSGDRADGDDRAESEDRVDPDAGDLRGAGA